LKLMLLSLFDNYFWKKNYKWWCKCHNKAELSICCRFSLH